MNTNKWSKTMDQMVPYMEWDSIDKAHRTSWNPVRHSNITVELHIIMEGKCEVDLEDRIVKLKQGQALVIFPNTFHTCKKIDGPFLRLTTSFILQDHSVLQGYENTGINHLIFNYDQEMKSLCYDIFAEYDKGAVYLGNEMLSALFSQLLVRCLRAIQPQVATIEKNNPVEGTLHIIDSFFSSLNMGEDYSRAKLAELLNCSERQVNRVLQNLCGMSFGEKKLLARIDYAKFLLRNTDLKMAEISRMVGYNDETSFYKVFKANCEITPQEFRIQSQKAEKKKKK